MWPWPDIAQLGMVYPRGFVAAVSNSVPACRRTGVDARLPNWYQRAPFRPPPDVATPLAFTSIVCAAHSVLTPLERSRCICTSKRIAWSSESRAFELPSAGCGMHGTVVGVVTKRFPEIDGLPPGLLIRRSANVP